LEENSKNTKFFRPHPKTSTYSCLLVFTDASKTNNHHSSIAFFSPEVPSLQKQFNLPHQTSVIKILKFQIDLNRGKLLKNRNLLKPKKTMINKNTTKNKKHSKNFGIDIEREKGRGETEGEREREKERNKGRFSIKRY